MDPVATIKGFYRHLADRGLSFEGVAIGGTALVLLGFIKRATKDCDILCPELPAEIVEAAREFAKAMTLAGEVLREDWFNNGPASLIRDLRPGWEQRLQPAFAGQSLVLRTLGRPDLLCAKLFALCDRQLDLADCLALVPSPDELSNTLPWLEDQDANPEWPAHVRSTITDLGRRLGHGL
jgi:hypothetical protein